MAARDELVAAIAGRYAQGDRSERGRILNEFTAVTGFHRKHAMRLLRVGEVKRRSGARPGRRAYDEAVREAKHAAGISEVPEHNSTLSTRSRRWPPPRISAFGKFRRKSEVEPAAESSAKSQSVRAPCSLRPCDHFLHVS